MDRINEQMYQANIELVDRNKLLEEDLKKAQKRIDTAIEYIESNPLVYMYDTDVYVTDIEQLEKGILELKFFRTLKEILKGEEDGDNW